MEPIYQENFEITSVYVDRNGRLKPSMILYFAQEVAGRYGVPLLCTAVRRDLLEQVQKLDALREYYPVDIYVKKLWEE